MKKHTQVSGVFDLFSFDEELIEIMYEAKKEKLGQKTDNKQAQVTEIQNQLKIVQEKQLKLADSFLAEVTPESVYKLKIEALTKEEKQLQDRLNQIKSQKDPNPESTLEYVKKIFLSAVQAKKEYLASDEFKKRNILEKLLWNAKIKDQKVVDFQLNKPYQLLAVGPKNRELEFWLGR